MNVLYLSGLALPYEKLARTLLSATIDRSRPWLNLRAIVSAEAISHEALEAKGTMLCRNHDRSWLPVVSLRLVSMASGMYIATSLPMSDAAVADIAHRRAEWRGWSVRFDPPSTSTRIDEGRGISRIVCADWFDEISVLVGIEPAFETWVHGVVCCSGAEVEAAAAAFAKRMKAEHFAAVRSQLGSNYRAWHRSLWDYPQQAAWLERGLRATDPSRYVPVEHVFRV